jgi:hypothetical protein
MRNKSHLLSQVLYKSFQYLYLSILILIVGPGALNAQNTCSLSPSYLSSISCISGYTSYYDNINASMTVDNILKKLKIENNYFVTKACGNLSNAVAVKYNGIRYILLDIEWMESLKSGTNDWFHLFVLGHEMAHHIYRHTDERTLDLNMRKKNELKCDEFAGYVLSVYGANEMDLKEVFTNFPDSIEPSSSHPGKDWRFKAAQKGFNYARSNESQKLLEAITTGSAFDMQELPNLLTAARRHYSNYLKNNDAVSLNAAIDAYKQCLRFFNYPELADELASLYLANGQRENYANTLEYAYQVTKEQEYVINLLGGLISIKYDVRDYLMKYKTFLDLVDYRDFKNYNNVSTLITLSRIYSYLARTQTTNGMDLFNLAKAKETLNLALKIVNAKQVKTQSDYNNSGEAYNELYLCSSIEGDYLSALGHIERAQSSFQLGQYMGDKTQEEIYGYYTYNIMTTMGNKAIVYTRLREWEKGLKVAREYQDTYNSLDSKKKDYLVSAMQLNYREIFYVFGRCFHGIENYNEAINYFTLVLADDNAPYTPGIINYYRALSYIGAQNIIEACKDLNIACSAGQKVACSRKISQCPN